MKKGFVVLILIILLLSMIGAYAHAAYSNQVGKFNYYSNAIRLKQELEQKGFKVYISDGPPYTVTVDRNSTYSEVVQVRNKLKKLNYQTFIVRVPDEKEQTQAEMKAVNVFPFLNDNVLRGVHSSQIMFFYLNENWEPSGNSYVDLYLSHSIVSTTHKSTLTVYLNDQPVNSFQITNQDKDNRKIRVYLPSKAMVNGYNNVMLRLYKRMSDNACEDLFNPGNWLRLKKDTMFHIEYKEVQDNLNLNQYPYPYFKVGRENPVDSIIVLPDSLDSRYLTAAAYIASGFGHREAYKNIKIEVENEKNSIARLNENNLIFIGNNEDYTSISGLPGSGVEPGDVVLEEFISPWNGNKKLLRIFGDKNNISKAARTLFYNDIVSQMKRKRQILKDNENARVDNILDRDKITLEDLKYGDVVVKGIYEQRATFNYTLPTGWQLKEGSSINFDYRYSGAIEFPQSSISVIVNGIPVGSRKLLAKDADGDKVSFLFPEELIKDTNFNIEVLFFFDVNDIDCTQLYEDKAWAVISNDSFLYLPHEEVRKDTLKDYPSMFFQNGKFEDTVIILPDNPRIDDVEIALNIFAYIGHQITDIGDIQLIKAADLTEDTKNKNIILIGTPGDSSIIKSINNNLPVKFDTGFAKLLPGDRIYFLEELGKEAGVVELVDSPWYEGRKMMVVSGVDYSTLKNAELLVTSIAIAEKLSGEVSMMDNTGEVYSFNINKNNDVVINEEEKKDDISNQLLTKLRSFIGQRNITILGIMLGFIITLLIILLIIIKRNYRK